MSRLHDSFRGVYRRGIQRGGITDGVRRARAMGEVRIWMQRAAIPSIAILACSRPVYAIVPSILDLQHARHLEDHHHLIHRDVLRHWRRVVVDRRKLLHHRVYAGIGVSEQVLP